MPQKPSNNLWLDKNRKTKPIGWSQIHSEAWHKNVIKQEHSKKTSGWTEVKRPNNADWSKFLAQHGTNT